MPETTIPPKSPNRIDPLAPPATEPDPPLHPFTTPLIPQAYLAVAVGVVGIAAVLLPIFAAGTVPHLICEVVVGLGAAFGIVSNGVKKKAPADA